MLEEIESKKPVGEVMRHDGAKPRPRSERGKKGQGVGGGRAPSPTSGVAIAKNEGRATRTAQRDLARVKALGAETLDAVAGTSRGSGKELDALAQLPEPDRKELIEKAAAKLKAEIAAELEEIDENLARADLSQAEIAVAIAERARIIKARSGQDCPKREAKTDKLGRRNEGRTPSPASTRDLVRKTGRSEGSIKTAQRRAKSLGMETLNKIIRTSLDKGPEMDALAQLPEPDHKDLVEKAAAKRKAEIEARRQLLAVLGCQSACHGRLFLH